MTVTHISRVVRERVVVLWVILLTLSLIALSYLLYGHDWLPMGWDTPRYVKDMKLIADYGILSFIAENDYYNFLYPVVGFSFTFIGFSPLQIEIILPLILITVVISLSARFINILFKDSSIMSYTILSLASWFTIYRVVADLHANLLSLGLILAVVSVLYLNSDKAQNTLYHLRIFFIMLVSSFTHIETTMFFVFIFFFTNLLATLVGTQHRLKILGSTVILFVVPVVPASLLYLSHINRVLSYTQGVIPPIQLQGWVHYLGPLAIPAFVGMYRLVRLSANMRLLRYHQIFVLVWALTSLAIATLHYPMQTLSIYSERAVTLFPAPFLAGFGFQLLLTKLNRFTYLSTKNIFALIFIAAIITYGYTSQLYHRVYISQAAYQKLLWLSQNYHTSLPPIFVLCASDEYSGPLGDLYDNWVGAVYGKHYSYLGPPQNLVTLSQTNYSSLISQQISSKFWKELMTEAILNSTIGIENPIILLTDFLSEQCSTQEYKPLLEEIHQGIAVFHWRSSSTTCHL